MKYNQLDIKSRKKITRPGRGISAGRGKTAGRGTKGQNSRSGGGTRLGFEGGQNPLMSRMPKLPGFTSHRAPAQEVYTGQLQDVKSKEINNQTLFEAGLIGNEHHTVKIITKGELTDAKKVEVQFASKSAVEMIQKAGGSFTKVERPKRTPKEGTEKAAKKS